MKSNKLSTKKMAILSLMAALSYIGFTFLRIDIPIGGSSTAIHFGNTFCVLAALLLGGLHGGLAGAIGLSIADLTIPIYAIYAPQTFLLKLIIGLITGLFAHKIFKITKIEDNKKLMRNVVLSASFAMFGNVLFDPIVSYLYKRFILGIDADIARIFAAWTAGSTFINAISSIIFASLLYLAIRKTIKNRNFFSKLLHGE